MFIPTANGSTFGAFCGHRMQSFSLRVNRYRYTNCQLMRVHMNCFHLNEDIETRDLSTRQVVGTNGKRVIGFFPFFPRSFLLRKNIKRSPFVIFDHEFPPEDKSIYLQYK